MRALKTLILVPAVLFAAACGRDDGQFDASLDSDLRLAGQAYTPDMDSISALERQDAQTELVATQPRQTTAAPVRRTTSAPRTTTAARTSTGTRTASAPAPTRAPQPVVTTRKNTGRDAAIGATAGAVIGATTSRDRVKGGLIGAAIGGIAGAVIGNNVDVKRDTVWR